MDHLTPLLRLGDPALLLRLGDPALTIPAALGIGAWLALAGAWRAAACWLLLFGAALGAVGADKIAFLGWGGGFPALGYHAASGHAAGTAALWPMLLSLLLPQRRRAAAAIGLGIGLLMVTLLVALDEHSLAEALAGWTIGAIASVTALCISPALPRPSLTGPPLDWSPLDWPPLARPPQDSPPFALRGQTPVPEKNPVGRAPPVRYFPATGLCPLLADSKLDWPALARPTFARPSFALPPLACHLAGVGVFVAAALLLRAAPTAYWLIKTALLLSGQRQLFPLHC